MVNTTTAPGARVGPMSLAARFIGVITSPRSTFEAIAAHPRWLGMLVLVTAIITAGAVLPMTSEAGQEAARCWQSGSACSTAGRPPLSPWHFTASMPSSLLFSRL